MRPRVASSPVPLSMYNLLEYGEMLQDQVRLRAYAQALKQVVPGKSVLEIGGGTGFFACLASKLGAAKVTSIDLSPLIQMGPQTAVANGVGNIHFIWGRSQEYRPAELADVLLHDLRGHTPYFENSLATLLDARRLIKPDAALIPRRDAVFACLVTDEAVYRRMEGIWGGQLEGIDLSQFRVEAHRLLRYTPSPESRPWARQRLVEIDYRSFDKTSLDTAYHMTADRSGICHGMVLWFETFLTEDVTFSTDPWLAPEQRGTTYGVSFLPWPTPLNLVQGRDYRVEVAISAQGAYEARVFALQGGFRELLGRFTSGQDTTSVLPLQARFEPRPKTRAFRSAMRAIETGRSVEQALAAISKSCPEIGDPSGASATLGKSFRLVEGTVRLPRGRRQALTFADLRLEIETWDHDLLGAVQKRLAPSWVSARRARSSPAAAVSLARAAHARGLVYLLELQGHRHLFADLESVLDQIESFVAQTVLPQSQDFLVLDCGHVVDNEGVGLILDDDLARREQVIQDAAGSSWGNPRVTLLDSKGRLWLYSTRGVPLPRIDRAAEVNRLLFLGTTEPTPAFCLAALVSRCRSNSRLSNPLALFSGLAQSARVVRIEPPRKEHSHG